MMDFLDIAEAIEALEISSSKDRTVRVRNKTDIRRFFYNPSMLFSIQGLYCYHDRLLNLRHE